MSAAEQHRFLLRLLFDAEVREAFFEDRPRVLAAHGLDAEDVAVFTALDREGLELDASMRRTCLMSALCRAYPLSAAALGCQRDGARSLASFLASAALFADLGKRSAAFGDHLRRLLEFDVFHLPPQVSGLVSAFLSYERALVDDAAKVRAELLERGVVEVPVRPARDGLLLRRVSLPPFLVLAELPVPPGVLKGALDQVGPEDAWLRIEAGRLSPERLLTVARADPMPVTVVARGWAHEGGLARAGVSPLVEVSHTAAALPGRRSALLGALDGTVALGMLPEPLRGIATRLAEAALLLVA